MLLRSPELIFHTRKVNYDSSNFLIPIIGTFNKRMRWILEFCISSTEIQAQLQFSALTRYLDIHISEQEMKNAKPIFSLEKEENSFQFPSLHRAIHAVFNEARATRKSRLLVASAPNNEAQLLRRQIHSKHHVYISNDITSRAWKISRWLPGFRSSQQASLYTLINPLILASDESSQTFIAAICTHTCI